MPNLLTCLVYWLICELFGLHFDCIRLHRPRCCVLTWHLLSVSTSNMYHHARMYRVCTALAKLHIQLGTEYSVLRTRVLPHLNLIAPRNHMLSTAELGQMQETSTVEVYVRMCAAYYRNASLPQQRHREGLVEERKKT